MKIIPKIFLQGGQFANRFVDYTVTKGTGSIFGASDSSSSSRRDRSSSEDSEKGKISEKDIFNAFNNFDALPSDLQLAVETTKMMYRRTLFSSNSPFDSQNLVDISAQRDILLNQAKFNKKMYDLAVESLRKGGGFDEIALHNGNVVVGDKDGNITEISPSEYLKNRDKYQAMTNSNLLWVRAYNKNYANDTSIIQIASDGIGMEQVVDMILKRIGSLGSDKEIKEKYIGAKGDLIVLGLELLQNENVLNELGLNGMTGIYKIKGISESLKKQLQAALNYIYTTLPPEAQALLQVKGGDASNPLKGAMNIIALKLTAMSNESSSFEIEYQDKFNPDGTLREKRGSSSENKDKHKENAAMMMLMGRGYRSTVNLIPGDNIGFRVNANMITLINSEGKPWKGNYLDELAYSGFGGILDITNASMGDGRKITNPEQVQIKDNHARMILFPAKYDGTPDFSQANMEKKKEADKQLEAMGIDVTNEEQFQDNYLKISEIYASVGLANGNNLKRFIVLDGITNNKALGTKNSFDDDAFLESVSEDEFKAYEDKWNREHSEGNYRAKLGLDPNNLLDWDGHDEVYRGLIWIPVFESWANAAIGTGQKIDSNEANNMDELEFNSQREERLHRQFTKPLDDD